MLASALLVARIPQILGGCPPLAGVDAEAFLGVEHLGGDLLGAADHRGALAAA
jgi:hypothetical protein